MRWHANLCVASTVVPSACWAERQHTMLCCRGYLSTVLEQNALLPQVSCWCSPHKGNTANLLQHKAEWFPGCIALSVQGTVAVHQELISAVLLP